MPISPHPPSRYHVTQIILYLKAVVPCPTPPHPGPLAGFKVTDLSHVMAGPTYAPMLTDMGAEVIKVEKYPGGDDARRMTPPPSPPNPTPL